MPAIDATNPRKKKKLKRPPTPDQQDRTRAAQTTATPDKPPVKVREFAHPGRKEPQKVIGQAVAHEQVQQTRRAVTRRAIRHVKVTPVASPDATDSNRSPQQLAHDRAVVKRVVRESREKAVSKQGRGAGVRAVKRELEGKGVLAKSLNAVGERAARNASGDIAVRAGFAPVPDHLGSRIIKDAVNLPAAAIPSLYVPAAAAVEAARGDTSRAKQFVKDVKETDPVYNTVAAGVEKVKGNDRAAREHLEKAKESASEHPGYTAAEIVGVRGAVGRGAGAVVRGTAKATGSKTLKRVGSTDRAPRVLPNTNLVEQRTYSKDLFRKTGQVLKDRDERRISAELRDQAQRATDPDERAELTRKAREGAHERGHRGDPTVMRDRDIARRVDEHVDAVEQVRRHHRLKATSETRKLTRRERKAGPLLNLLAQRIVRADVGDLKAYVRDLEGEHGSLGPAGQRANEQLRHKLTKAIRQSEAGKLDLQRVKAAADEYARRSKAGQDELVGRGLLDGEQAERASLIPYAVRRMGAKHDGDQMTVKGTPLSTAAIRAHMAAAGEEPPAFLSQAPNARGAKNFYVSGARPPQATGARRTGEATRKGTFDAHPDTLEEQAARTQGLADAFDHFQQFVDEFGYRDPRSRGGIRTKRTKQAADQLARDLSAGDTQWSAVRINPFGATKVQLHEMLEGTEPGTPVHTALTKALDGDDGEGPWAIVPKAAADRMQEHLRVLNPGNAGRVFRAGNSAFRKTVLATSLPWLVGNVTEATLRTALAAAGPRSYVTGRRVLKRAAELDDKRAEMSQARTVGGGHFGFAERQHVHTNLDQFKDGATKDLARPIVTAMKAPGPKQVAAVWNGWTHLVFQTVNKTVEQQFQTAMLGKAVRENLMSDNLIKLSRKATDEAARGFLDRNAAVALGREIDTMYGKYGKYSPDMRKALALYTPFAAWTLNAATFVVKTLPKDHPVALAVLASTVHATEEWRAEYGLDKFVDNAVPGWLQGSIPAADGVKYRAPTRYTPFGLFTDPLESAASAVLPQFSGVLSAFKGQDWKGNKLRDPVTAGDLDDIGKAKVAARSFAESTVPFLALGGRIKKKGAKSAILDATLGKVEPAGEEPVLSTPRLSRKAKGSFGGSSYGKGSLGKSSYGGSSFK